MTITNTRLICFTLNELIPKVMICMTTSFNYLCKRQSKGPEPVRDLLE